MILGTILIGLSFPPLKIMPVYWVFPGALALLIGYAMGSDL